MTLIKDDKIKFFVIWTLWSTLLIPAGVILGGLVGLGVSAGFGYGYDGGEPPFVSIFVYCGWVSVIGAVISLNQWLLLRRKIEISALWILACIGGFIIGETVVGLFLWKLEISRGDLGWAEGGSILAEALIFTFSGILIGLFQYTLLRKVYRKAGLWVVVSTISWGLVPLVIYIFGGLTLGAITGATLIWILQLKEE